MTTSSQILETYRISLVSQEIIDVLAKNHADEKCMMWQTFSEHRTIYNFKKYKLDLVKKRIIVIYDSQKDKVDPDHPVYVKLPFRETLFKGTVIDSRNNEVLLDVPSEVHMREYRESLRRTFEPREHFAYLKPLVTGIPMDRIPTLKVEIKDISVKGLGLLLKESIFPYFKKGEILELYKLDEVDLVRPIVGKIVYAGRDAKSTRNELPYRAGINLMSQIPGDLMEKFLVNRRAPIITASELLNKDIFSEEFRQLIQTETARTVMKLKHRAAVGKLLQQLEVSRNEDDYIEEHIKILTIVSTLFARTLNWVSEASVEKFIYAAYLHDAPLFKHPHLLKIKNSQEFELIKSKLTPEEQLLYLTAPEAAASIAANDPAAPLDVLQMLAMQKELPDGSGFPKHYKHNKFTPMAALFIIAHDFTDEIMRNPEWNMEFWYPRAKTIYKGSHFDKILDAMSAAKVTLKR